MTNKYAETMRSFFESSDYNRSRENPSRLALAFADHFRSATPIQATGHSRHSIALPASDDIYNVSILARNTSLSFLTKRVSLVADTTVLTHYREKAHIFVEDVDLDMPRPGSPSRSTWGYLRCPDLEELGKWLEECKPLLQSGDLFYFPDILVKRTVEYEDSYYEPVSEESSVGPICDLIVRNKKIVDTLPAEIVKSQIVVPILQTDLPYIGNVDLETFCKITADERKPIEQFRDCLREKFLDLKRNEGSEHFETNLAKIGIELREGVRQLDSELTKIKQKRAFQATMGVIAATAAILVAVNSATFSRLPEVLGSSGGLLLILKALEEHLSERRTISDSPYYYLWLFSKKAGS